MSVFLARSLPWALIGAACLGSFAATSSGTTRAPFHLDMSHDLGVAMPLVANLVFALTGDGLGHYLGVGGWLSDLLGRRPLLIIAPFALALTLVAQAARGRSSGSRSGPPRAAGAPGAFYRRGLCGGLGTRPRQPAGTRAGLGS